MIFLSRKRWWDQWPRVRNWVWLVINTVPAFPGGAVVRNLPANAGGSSSIPGSGRSTGGGNGNPLQFSCLGNPMDRGAWLATVYGVSKELDAAKRQQSIVPQGSHKGGQNKGSGVSRFGFIKTVPLAPREIGRKIIKSWEEARVVGIWEEKKWCELLTY